MYIIYVETGINRIDSNNNLEYNTLCFTTDSKVVDFYKKSNSVRVIESDYTELEEVFNDAYSRLDKPLHRPKHWRLTLTRDLSTRIMLIVAPTMDIRVVLKTVTNHSKNKLTVDCNINHLIVNVYVPINEENPSNFSIRIINQILEPYQNLNLSIKEFESIINTSYKQYLP